MTRRTVLASSAALALVSARPVWATSSDFDATVADVRDRLTRFHQDQGLAARAPGSLVTDRPDINGGLRYDDSDVLDGYGIFVSQPAARIEDAAEKGRAGVLPLFEIFAGRGAENGAAGTTVNRCVDVIVDVLQLDPDRIAFVSTPDFYRVSPFLEQRGLIRPDNVSYREPAAARAAANGSGYFQAPGSDRGFWTAGMYYALNDDPGPVQDGAGTGWIEIGEFSIEGEREPSYGFGLERLAMALTGDMPSWQDREPMLQARIAAERG
ncbi:MAG: hypothetical protein AAGC86_16675 [Pseudomonadota bacterium]